MNRSWYLCWYWYGGEGGGTVYSMYKMIRKGIECTHEFRDFAPNPFQIPKIRATFLQLFISVRVSAR
jgi:hypothetical protein